MQESDYKFIQKFSRGHRLPYSKYDETYLVDVLSHKHNNAAAIMVCLDALEAYIYKPDANAGMEGIDMLYDEIARFSIYGLFGIGFFGMSVENGIPIRVDSCGMNISKQYRSVYRNMTSEEYAQLDRIDSMLLDQREERKFRQYILKYEYALLNTLNTVLSETEYSDSAANPVLSECLELDQMFCSLCIKIGRADPRSNINSAWNAASVLSDVKMLMMPYRNILEKDNVTVLPDYTIADLNPVQTAEIKKYRAASIKDDTQH